jgi:hypothetical protein
MEYLIRMDEIYMYMSGGSNSNSWHSSVRGDAIKVKHGQMTLDEYVDKYSVASGTMEAVYGKDYSNFQADFNTQKRGGQEGKLLRYEITLSAKLNNGEQGDPDPPWVWFLKKHYYVEAQARATLGAQATILPTEAGLVPAPYVKGLIGVNVNVGSVVLWEGTADSKNGARTTATLGQKFTQGLGFGIGGLNVDYEREITRNGSVHTGNVVILGLFGVEINSNREFFIGLMPGAKWALGFGIEGEVKSGLKFEF